jgi:hypothetical protein
MAYGKIDLYKYMFGTPKDAGVNLSLLCSIPITSTLRGYMAMGFYIEGQDALEDMTESAYNASK